MTDTRTTTTTTVATAPTFSTRPVVHEVVDIRERDQTKTAERLEQLVLEQKKLHEEMLAKQRSEFHKENLKLLNRLRNTEPSQPHQTSNNTNLYIAISLLGGSLIGVLIAVAACYCCRRDTHEKRSKDRHSSSSGNALHMTI